MEICQTQDGSLDDQNKSKGTLLGSKKGTDDWFL